MRLGAFIAPPLLARLRGPAAGQRLMRDRRAPGRPARERRLRRHDRRVERPADREAVRAGPGAGEDHRRRGWSSRRRGKALGKLGRPGLGTRTLEAGRMRLGRRVAADAPWRRGGSLRGSSTVTSASTPMRPFAVFRGGRGSSRTVAGPATTRALARACDVAGRMSAALRPVHRRLQSAVSTHAGVDFPLRPGRRCSPRARGRRRQRLAGGHGRCARHEQGVSTVYDTVRDPLKPGAQARRRARLGRLGSAMLS